MITTLFLIILSIFSFTHFIKGIYDRQKTHEKFNQYLDLISEMREYHTSIKNQTIAENYINHLLKILPKSPDEFHKNKTFYNIKKQKDTIRKIYGKHIKHPNWIKQERQEKLKQLL